MRRPVTDYQCLDVDKTTTKATVTLSKDTVQWLEETYPDALSIQEAVRMAISDAREDVGEPPDDAESD